MPGAASARRYAQAVFQIALEQDDFDAWRSDLEAAAGALENPEFAGLLDAPQLPTAAKADTIREALGGSMAPLGLNLVSLLASRGLAHLIPSVLDEYVRMLDSHEGVERAEVVAAVPLDKGHEGKIAELLEGIVGKKIKLSSTQQPRIIGGLIARVGDRVIDGSVRARLRNLRRELAESL